MAHLPAVAQQANDIPAIHLKSGVVHPSANAAVWIDSIQRLPAASEPLQVLITFSALPTQAQRQKLAESGITLQDYIPNNTFSATIKIFSGIQILQSMPVFSITSMKPEWKADTYLWSKISAATGAVEVLVSFYPGIDAATVKQFASGVGAQINPGPMEHYGKYKIIIAASRVRTIAQWYGVRYISPVTDIVPLDLQSRPAVKGNIAVAPATYGGYALAGDSVTVGVGDNAAGIYHADLKDRITNFNPAPQATHGEHVNGIVGGAAIVDPLAASMAPHVSLVDHLYDFVLTSTGALYHDYNMTLSNNSYEIIAGDCDYSGTYDAYAELIDTLIMQYPNVLHVFAAGNDGWMSCSPFVQGFATVGGGYQCAKNNVVVGSMTDYLIEASDESRGPTKDGRLKPEIIAIGLGSYSTAGVDQYVWDAGTSMASPQVAGGLAVLTQRYKQLHSGTQPQADVLKTILLNGAMDLGNPGPDYSYGYGAMDVSRSLQIMDNNHYSTNTISNGAAQSQNITVPANTAQLKVMLYWNDVPASPSSSLQLVNDLDLTVKDPALATHLPLVLDATPANVNNNATEQADHLNNSEQVTITNPAAGTYSININGYSIPSGPQRYVIAYDIIPKGLQLTYPIGGEQLSNVDSIRIFWNAISDGNTFTVEFSSDNGTSWIPIANDVPADIRHCDFMPTGYNSGKCMVRVLRNGTSDAGTSASFAISTQPVAQLSASQCPGYMSIHWSPVPGATSYQLLRKVGFYMQLVGTATDTTYTFSGLSLTDKSYVAVQPVIDGIPGYRSLAVIAVANTGDCSNPVSAGDLMLEKIDSPSSGRQFTSSQFGASTTVWIKARNLYTTSCSNYTLSYKVNSGAWQTVAGSTTIPANSTAEIGIPGFSFATPGTYTITVAIHNNALTDPQHGNDTATVTILSLPNVPVDLTTSFTDDFEAMPIFGVSHDSIGVSPNAHWDYFNANDSGRVRSFVNDNITISGTRSVSLDENQCVTNGSSNRFIGTFNLSAYDTAATEVRVDFDYILHGMPKTPDGNIVTTRGIDTAIWQSLFTYNLNAYPGQVSHVQSLSLTDAIRLGKHNFSPSTQVSFGQNDTSLIADASYGNGITIDNFSMYTVANDAQLVSVVSPLPTNCGLPASVPLTVQVHNGVNYTLHNVQLFYSLNSGTVYTGTIDSIKAKDTVSYTFIQPLSIAAGATYSLDVWLSEAGDTYTANDSILNYHFRNSVIVTNYPYLENFESGDGGYYTDGINDTWQYGTPASPKINKAASGTKAWKTNLTGNYKNLSTAYLYSPCFDLSSLTDPMLSFSTAQAIENCGNTLCDQAYIEYSFDGVVWTKLGAAGQGTNWYDSTFDIWNTLNFTRWHVASIPLPQPAIGQSIRFRFVLSSDPSANYEGFAVDDIHIFDLSASIFPANGITTATHDLSGTQWTDYLQNNQLLASVQPNNQSIPGTDVALYSQDTLNNPGATQYVMPRSYTIKSSQAAADSIGIRLYLLDSDVVNVLQDTTCPSCTSLTDAYSLGVTQYSNSNNATVENGTLADDTGGVFTYYPYTKVKWVPYDKGYYAELTVKPFSEFWFNNGGPLANFSAGTDYLNFVAFKSGQNVTTYWYSLIDTAVNTYSLQRATDSITAGFTTILDTVATHANPGSYAYTDPVNFTSSDTYYYRLRWTMTGKDGYYYSPIRKVSVVDSASNLVMLNAAMVNHQSVLVNWTSYIDGMVDHYTLERAIDMGSYQFIDSSTAYHHYGQQYYYTDIFDHAIRQGAPIHYRLTAILQNGSTVVLLIRTIEWINNNSFTNVYPNPTHNGTFTINWQADAGTVIDISMADVAGRSFYHSSATATQWNNTTVVQTNALPKGIYFVRMDIGGTRYTAKIVYE